MAEEGNQNPWNFNHLQELVDAKATLVKKKQNNAARQRKHRKRKKGTEKH